MPRALILGGTGAIGLATARRLLAQGWQIDVTGRDPGRMTDDLARGGARFLSPDRRDPGELGDALGDGADLLVDCICFTAGDAELLLPLARQSASTVVISSRAVYVDADGNHVNGDTAPRFPAPVTEEQATLPPGGGDPGSREGYAPNKVAAERVLLESGLPVTVLRPSKVHGAGARCPRTWAVVRRILAGRPAVVLADRGASVDHTTAAANVAALIEVVAARPGSRVLNTADPDAPSALEIVRTIAAHLGHVWEEVLLDGPAVEGVGAFPWEARHPFVLDTTAASALGYVPAGSFAATVPDEVDWLVAAARGGADAAALPPADDPFFARYLDLTAEDRFLRERE